MEKTFKEKEMILVTTISVSYDTENCCGGGSWKSNESSILNESDLHKIYFPFKNGDLASNPEFFVRLSNGETVESEEVHTGDEDNDYMRVSSVYFFKKITVLVSPENQIFFSATDILGTTLVERKLRYF